MKNSTLKIIACLTMLIDHVGAILFPDVLLLRWIGRISFPIFAFLLVEGYFHTRNLKKYLIRLGVFALICEVPYDLAFHGVILEFGKQNIFLTLLLGLLTILYYEKNKQNPGIASAIVGLFCVLNTMLAGDYYFFGILLIFGFYRYRENKIGITIWLISINIFQLLMIYALMNEWNNDAIMSFLELLSLPLIFLYNGTKGLSLKYLFYLFYPLHLLILYGISILV